MSLEPGQKLGHFEIVEPIGKGGMGEVYRAKDAELGRDVEEETPPSRELPISDEGAGWRHSGHCGLHEPGASQRQARR